MFLLISFLSNYNQNSDVHLFHSNFYKLDTFLVQEYFHRKEATREAIIIIIFLSKSKWADLAANFPNSTTNNTIIIRWVKVFIMGTGWALSVIEIHLLCNYKLHCHLSPTFKHLELFFLNSYGQRWCGTWIHGYKEKFRVMYPYSVLQSGV